MKNLQTGTTCLSSSTGSKQRRCDSPLQRLATCVILFLCSMTAAWAEGTGTTTGDNTFTFKQNSKDDKSHTSGDGSITATFSSEGLTYRDNSVQFPKNGTGTLTITANAATISKVSLLVSNSSTKPQSGKDVTPGTTEITIGQHKMPVEWSSDNKKVVFKCSTTNNLYVFGATITYKYIDDGKLKLNAVSAPTIEINDKETTTSQLSFTIKQTAEAQDGTYLETWYTTDGSNPNSTVNGNSTKLTQNPQTVTMDWTKGQKVTVRTFTKRVDSKDATNTNIGGETQQEFSNTGSTELASVDAPVITPGDQAIVAASLDVTISDKQLTQALAKKLKVYYAINDKIKEGGTTMGDWQEITSWPCKLTLTKSSTVQAYAEYTDASGNKTKSDVASRTYFLLDDATTYINTAASQNVGTTVEKNGMTMTFGGIKVGTQNFKELSKNDNVDANVLGSIHTVSGTPLFVNVDVESEVGDGKIGPKSIDGAEYFHCNASSKKLHENTFGLPAMGSFFKFEPEANGRLTVFVEQQGAIHNTDGHLFPSKVRKRPVYFLDETGKSIPARFAYTSSKVNKTDWTTIRNTATDTDDNFYSKEYMDELEKYYQNIIDGKNTTFTNFNSAVAKDDKNKALTLGTSIQPIIVLHEACNADILKGDGMSETGDDEYDHTGYMLISEGYVTYTFPVEAGKTYYLFASRTKLALSGFCFDKDASYSATDVTLDGKADNTDAINKLEVGKQYNVTLNNRSFGANKWYAVVLPFSVSQKQMKSVFGDGVKVLHYSDVDGTDLNLFEHFYQMIVGGTPVLVKPSQDVTNPVFKNVTLTSKTVVDIENTGFKCTGSWDNVDFPEYSYFIDAKTNSFYLYDPTKVETNTVKPHAGAFRSWIISTSTNPSEAKQLTMHINGIEEQGETTAIWNAISGNDDAEVASKGIYSLSGQKMNAADTRSLPKGIYIVNGKKFIVK